MKRFSKIILVILTIIYIVCSLLIYKGTRCIDNLAYTIAMGIDKGSSSKYNISFQFTKPSSGKDSSSSSSSTSSFVRFTSSSGSFAYSNLKCPHSL